MNRRRWFLLSAAILASVLLTTGVVAATQPAIERHVIASGADTVVSGDIVLHATVGESIAGPIVVAGASEVGAGFWQRLPEDFWSFLPSMLSSD